MEKRTQTFSMVGLNKEPKSIPHSKIKSFDQYVQEVKAKKLADQMYKDQLMNDLIDAKMKLAAKADAPVITDEIKKMIIETHTVITKKVSPDEVKTKAKRSKKQLMQEKIDAIRLDRMLEID